MCYCYRCLPSWPCHLKWLNVLLLQLAAIVTLPFDVIKTHRQVELGEIEVYAGGSFISLTSSHYLCLCTFISLTLSISHHLITFVSLTLSISLHLFIFISLQFTFVSLPSLFVPLSFYCHLFTFIYFETPSSLWYIYLFHLTFISLPLSLYFYILPLSLYHHLFDFVSLPSSLSLSLYRLSLIHIWRCRRWP